MLATINPIINHFDVLKLPCMRYFVAIGYNAPEMLLHEMQLVKLEFLGQTLGDATSQQACMTSS